jgi:hypothetical protein
MTNYATGVGLTPVIVFRNHSERTTEVCYTPAKNFTNPNDDVYDFVAENDDQNVWNYVNNGGKYSHSPYSAPTTSRMNLPDFINAIRAEPSFDASVRLGLRPILQSHGPYSGDSNHMQQDWQDMIEVFGDSWLTKVVQNKILKYAAQYGVPLK